MQLRPCAGKESAFVCWDQGCGSSCSLLQDKGQASSWLPGRKVRQGHGWGMRELGAPVGPAANPGTLPLAGCTEPRKPVITGPATLTPGPGLALSPE